MFNKILSPFNIRDTTFKNRIFISSHSYGYIDDGGLPTEDYIYYVRERILGGVGSIILGTTAVQQDGWHGGGYALNDSDEIIPIYQQLADIAQQHNTVLLDQLFHAGGQLRYDKGLEVFAPSPIPHARTISLPVELTITQIKKIIQSFTNAAIRVEKGGLHGVEISAAQGWLIQQFLSPHFNRRTDKYGGSADNRLRFLVEILESIRSKASSSFIVGIRLSISTASNSGIETNQAIKFINKLDKLNLIDFSHIIGATNSTFQEYLAGHGDMSIPEANFAKLGSLIKSETHLPVLLASKVLNPAQAEELIADNCADLVAMTRAHIADPEIVNKASDKREQDIRPCISCNQECVGNSMKRLGVKCIYNPVTGREKHFGKTKIISTSIQKNIVIVGGGPAGMEAARICAERGHKVQIFEKASKLGGQLNLAAIPPHRNDFIKIVNYLEQQLHHLQVETILNTELTQADILNLNADELIVAIGSEPRIPILDFKDQSKILDAHTALRNYEKLGKHILLVDADWKLHPLSIAELLADHGKEVIVINQGFQVGAGLDITNITSFTTRLLKKGVQLLDLRDIYEVEADKVILRHSLTNELEVLQDIDNIIYAVGSNPNRFEYNIENDEDKHIYKIGDCVYPRGLHIAMFDALKIATTL